MQCNCNHPDPEVFVVSVYRDSNNASCLRRKQCSELDCCVAVRRVVGPCRAICPAAVADCIWYYVTEVTTVGNGQSFLYRVRDD